jgi:MotA/TolQ/ExbB proton channel family
MATALDAPRLAPPPPAAEAGADARRYLLLLRFAILNLTGLALLLAAWAQGWVGAVLAADTTGIVALIGCAFALGLGLCGRRIAGVSRELNELASPRPDPRSRAGAYLAAVRGLDPQARANVAGALRLKLAHRGGLVRLFANSLVLLGLIGTVVGFVLALAGVSAEGARDVEAVGPMVAGLVAGMSVALHTTLVGSVLSLWLTLNHRLLETGLVHLFTALVERGERAGAGGGPGHA